jgi:GFO/IDH/MocA oxidoreductase family protein
MRHRLSTTARAVPRGTNISRRRFLGGAMGAVAAPWIAPAAALGLGGMPAPSERIGIAGIGIGSRGTNHVDTFLSMPEAQVLAVCDPYRSKREGARKQIEERYTKKGGAPYKGCAATADFREVLARPDIDAVFIASPENWHALQAAEAARAGKDIYCEKALSRTVAEGRALCEAVRRHGRVLQVGTQQRSDRNFRHACELARNGYLGKVHTVKVGVPGGRELPVAAVAPVPPDLDYEMWLGPAPSTPYNDVKCTFNWYFMSDYCAGWIQSWGVHHIDIALWGVPSLSSGALEIEGAARFPVRGLADTSVTWQVEMRSHDGVRLLFADEGHLPHGVRFEGEKGWVHVVRGGIQAEPASLLALKMGSSDERLYESADHHVNFLECVRSRREPVAPVEAGHRATVVTLISDIATRLGRRLTWDWRAERFIDEGAGADRLLRRPMRSPWVL